MKRYFNHFLWLFSICLVIVACRKQEHNKNENEPAIMGKVETTCNFTPNMNNPYNYVGQIHNEILGEYWANFGADTSRNIEVILGRINSICESNDNFLERIDTNYQQISTEKILAGVEDFDNHFSNLIDNLNVTLTAKSKLQQLVDYFFTKSEQTTFPTLNEVDDYLSSFEDEIIETEYNTTDKKMLLCAATVARYSSCFWYHHFDVENQQDVVVAGKRKWWQWLIVVGSDLIGGAVGAIPAAGAPPVGGSTIISSASVASGVAATLTNPSTK